ncbi:Flp family type IVb pilin [Nitratireductor pacificus]|uniref:Pilus subunit protein PilA n=1 Tax=Nitratireductor pacificus pht-3B TaxID=391937 RepID=K2M9S9_9HYPH|nr:Flp family type IVb pilin [Nitratireductor pacificus]EKF17760.1 pilus subunit protein PilA [Nitratireductor pacificus pht-3B]
MFKQFLANRSGATAIEYALLAGLIALVIIGGIRGMGTSLQGTMEDVASQTSEVMKQ